MCLRNLRPLIGVALFASVMLIAGCLMWVELTSPFDTKPIYVIPVVVGAVVGLVLSMRVPENNIGILLLVASLAMGGLGAGDVIMAWGVANDYRFLAMVASLVNDTSWAALLVSVLIMLPISFPDGVPVNRWSHWVARSALILAGVAITGFWLAENICVSWMGADCLRYEQSPWGIPGWDGSSLEPLLLVVLLLSVPAVSSAVIRWRRSTGVARQQLKWFVFAASGLVLGVLMSRDWVPSPTVGDVAAVLLYSSLWVSIGVAVLKYRLYDLDRLISRTVGYALLLALLGGVYVTGAIWLPTRLIGEQPPIFVAGSTLAVAMLFNPVRKRVLSWVDRRFNRTRYDAQHVIDEFVGQLRNTTQVDQLTEDVVSLVEVTLQPSSVGAWIQEDSA